MLPESCSKYLKEKTIFNKSCLCSTDVSKRLVYTIFTLTFISAIIYIYNTSSYGSISIDDASQKVEVIQSKNVFPGKHLKVRGTQRRLPQAIIIGARKCGTRALLEMASLHPYIMKKGTEVHFFDTTRIFANGYEWYRKKMPYTYNNQVTIEKTPSYFVSPDAPERIRLMNNSIRLILIVREPVYRIISDYAQVMESRKTKGKPIIPFDQLVLNKDGEINSSYSAIKISQYYVHMAYWLRVFPLKQFLIIDGEQLVKDPFSVLVKVEKFLHLPPRFSPWNFYFNATKGFFCMRNETRQKCLQNSKGRKHPFVDPAVVEKLREYFAPFNDNFYDLIQQNFSWVTT